jgi:preprotein translocase subunit YajC
MWYLAMAPAPQGAQQGNPLLSLLPIIFIFVIFYFLLIRPQTQRQKKHVAMVEALKKGDKIVTIGGIYGTVVIVKKSTLSIEISKGVRIDINKTAVAGLQGAEDETAPPTDMQQLTE